MIMLHGLGDTGDGWSFLPQMVDVDYVQYIFPTAPILPVTLNYGMKMPAWYDLPQDLNDVVARTFDKEGIDASVKYVRDLVDEAIRDGTPPERIIIGGFSQGGHIAYKAALLHEPQVAACVALSTYMDPLGVENILEDNKQMPIFVGHGTADPVIDVDLCNRSVQLMEDHGVTGIEKQLYHGVGHSATPEEFAHLTAFIKKHVPPKDP